jgi:tetratricopeptide (TPR) repeat protein
MSTMDIQPPLPRKTGLLDFQFSLGRLLAAITLCAVLLPFLFRYVCRTDSFNGPGDFATICGLMAMVSLLVLFCDWSYWHKSNAVAAFGAGNYERAVTEYTRAIAAKPHDPEGLIGRGAAHYQLEDMTQAIQDFTAAIQLNGRLAGVWFWRALASQAIHEFQRSVDDATVGLCFEPENAHGLSIRGYSYCLAGDVVSGVSDLNEAVRISGNDPSVRGFRALAYLYVGEYASALADFADDGLGQRNGTGLFGRTMTLFKLGRYEQAIQEADEFLATGAQDMYALSSLAWFMATCPIPSLRDGERSLRLAQQAANLTRRKWWLVHASLAAAYAEIGDFEEAIRQGEIACQLAPAHWRIECRAALSCYAMQLPYRDGADRGGTCGKELETRGSEPPS